LARTLGENSTVNFNFVLMQPFLAKSSKGRKTQQNN